MRCLNLLPIKLERSLRCGKGLSGGTWMPRKVHNGSQPCLMLWTSSLSGATRFLTFSMCLLKMAMALPFGQVKSKLIIEQWDEMRRVASSIRHGTVSASLLMRKLATYPRQNQVAHALTEMGKLERTSFLLEYFRDKSLRRRILMVLWRAPCYTRF